MIACLHCGLPVPPRRSADFCCFGCRVMHGVVRPAGEDGEVGPVPLLRVQLFAGLFVALNVMALSFAFYGPGVFGEDAIPAGLWGSVAELFEYLLLFLTTIVVATLGLPLFVDALHDGSGRFGWINARTLVCFGVFAAFVLSAGHTFRGIDPVYYDTVTMVLVVITIGKHLEARAKRRAARELIGALDELPDRVEVIRDGQRFETNVGSLVLGDRVRVRPGEAVPVDGRIDDGCSFVDSSGITGEPHAVSLGPGDRVLAGSIAIDGLLWVQAEQVDGDRLLAQVDRLLHEALETRFPAVRTADRFARILAPVVVLTAIVVAAWFAIGGAPAEGMLRGLSVLLIACPCALAIGPSLIMVGAMRRSVRRGILFTSPVTVERTAGLGRIFLDKTGTLTRAASRVEEIDVPAGSRREEILGLLASIEAQGDHPIAAGIGRFARERGIEPGPVESYRTLAGRGVEAVVNGRRYLVGGERLLASIGIEPQNESGESAIYLVEDDAIVATAVVSDPPRPDAAEALSRLTGLGLRAAGLSGDSESRARALGDQLHLSIEGEMLPADKAERVRQAVESSSAGTVAMVGDGVNDAAALANAEVGIAVASATDLSRQAGDLLLLRDRLTLIPDAIEIARDARRRLRVSLAWALGYNAVGVCMAATGNLHPVFAATAMAVSSLLVIGFARNAGRLPGPVADEPRSPEAGEAAEVPA